MPNYLNHLIGPYTADNDCRRENHYNRRCEVKYQQKAKERYCLNWSQHFSLPVRKLSRKTTCILIASFDKITCHFIRKKNFLITLTL